MRSRLVAASEEDLSPGVSSSPQVKWPGCPPGEGKSGRTSEHSHKEPALHSPWHPGQPSGSRDKEGREPHREVARNGVGGVGGSLQIQRKNQGPMGGWGRSSRKREEKQSPRVEGRAPEWRLDRETGNRDSEKRNSPGVLTTKNLGFESKS